MWIWRFECSQWFEKNQYSTFKNVENSKFLPGMLKWTVFASHNCKVEEKRYSIKILCPSFRESWLILFTLKLWHKPVVKLKKVDLSIFSLFFVTKTHVFRQFQCVFLGTHFGWFRKTRKNQENHRQKSDCDFLPCFLGEHTCPKTRLFRNTFLLVFLNDRKCVFSQTQLTFGL